MPTMKDVARLASVSVATVSNYLNGTKHVKEETRKRIKKALEELNFHPNAYARNLKANTSNEVGIIIPDTYDSYYSYILKGIEKILQNNGFYLNIGFSNEVPDIETKVIKKMLQKNISGAIIITCQPHNHSFFNNCFIKKNLPVVFLDRAIQDLDTNLVYFDNGKTVEYLTQRLIDNGLSKIGLIVGPKEYSSEQHCIDGFKHAFARNGLALDQHWISYTNLSKEDAFRSAIFMLQNHNLQGIITSSETISKGLIEAAHVRGIDIPGNLLVLSLGQDRWNLYSSSQGVINTLRPALNMGEEAARLLIKNMQSPILFEKQRIVLEDKVVYKDIELKNRTTKSEITLVKKGTLNVLMLESPTAVSIEGLLPHFTNNTFIDVNIKTYPQQYILDKIISDARSKSQDIDVYMFDIPWLPFIASNKYLMNLTKFINAHDFDKNIFIPGTLKHFSEFEGEYYGVPFMYAPQILFYRKDLFEDKSLKREFEARYKTELTPPDTWLEFNAIAEFFTKSLNPSSPVEYGTSVAANYSELLVPEFLPRLWSYNGRIFNEQNKVTFNSPETIKAMTNFCKTFEFTRPDTLNQRIEDTVADFYEGKTAMLICYISYTTDITNRFKSDIVGKIGYDFIPGKTPVLGGWSMGINPNSKNPKQAFKFINWACGTDICNYHTILEGQSPLMDVYNNDELDKLYPWLPLGLETFKYCRTRKGPHIQGGKIIPQDNIEFIIAKAIYSVLKKETTIENALNTAQQALEQLFEDYGYPQK